MFSKRFSTTFRAAPYPGIAIGIRTDDMNHDLAKDGSDEVFASVKSRLTTIMIPLFEIGIETVTVCGEKEEYVDEIINELNEME